MMPDVVQISRRDLERNSYGRSKLGDIAPHAWRMWHVCDVAESVHGLSNIASRFYTLAECGALAAQAPVGVALDAGGGPLR